MSQTHMGTSTRLGYSQRGYCFDQVLNLEFNRHQLEAGVRYYALSYLLEKNTPGFVIRYSFVEGYPGMIFKTKKMYIGYGMSVSFFHENKTTVDLGITELFGTLKMGLSFNDRWSVYEQIGLGCILNRHSNSNLDSKNTTTYFGYEVALGVKYYWRIPSSN